MFLTIFGLILILTPFLVVFCFKDKLLGFLYVITFSSIFHLTIALTSQYLHYFSYQIVVSANLILALITVIAFIKNKKPIQQIHINWLAIIAFSIIIFELWSVHFNYTGPLISINGQTVAHHQTLKYPYYSDEWVGVALTRYSIETQSLPIVNTLDQTSFVNPMIAHFSILSEFFLILGIDPLTGYPVFSIITGLLICFFIFLLLRVNNINNFLAIIITLSTPFIVNSSTLPGIWYLLPFITSLIALLISLIAFSIKNSIIGFISSIMSFVLYPPMAIFIVPANAMYIFIEKIKTKLKIKHLIFGLVSLAILSLMVTSISIGKGNILDTIQIIKSFILRVNFDAGVPNLSPWIIIPYYLLPLALIGIYQAIVKRKYYILAPFILGLIFWTAYTFTQNVLIIDHYRVVVITSIFTLIFAGFGLQYLVDLYVTRFGLINSKLKIILKIAILLIFITVSFYYTQRQDWKYLTLRTNSSSLQDKMIPAPPANQYLLSEDIDIFKGINGKIFVAPPWKALTVAIATGNYPTETKSSTINARIFSYSDFVNSNCDAKKEVANKFNVDYLYIKRIYCPAFQEISHSSEGLFLYKMVK